MYNSSINNSLILRYKIKFSKLNLVRKQVNTVIRYLNFNDNIFLELFNDKNLFMFNKNKFLLNNIKKYYHYRLAYFFLKKYFFFFLVF